jgi:hypothetical protein
VFGFDPAADYAALTKESRGRRMFPAAPEHSLMLSKASGTVAHGGGVRIRRDTSEYETLRAWIAAGAPFGSPNDPTVVSLHIEPPERRLAVLGRQQLRVLARFSDGQETDVTPHAKYQSNNEGLASVNATGLVAAGEAPGDVAIMAGYRNAVAVFRAIIPRPEPIAHYPTLPENNFIDQLVFRKLRKLNLLPSEPADDATYLRRVYLDVIGTLPTAEEARRFLRDARPDRRTRLVDELLKQSEFADYWALKWADLVRVDRQALGHKHAYSYYRWIRESVAASKPLDQFARELLTAAERSGTGQFLQSRRQTRRRGQHTDAGFSRRAPGLCRVPSSSVRPLESDRLLRHAGVLYSAKHTGRGGTAGRPCLNRECHNRGGDPANCRRSLNTASAHRRVHLCARSRCENARPFYAGRPPPDPCALADGAGKSLVCPQPGEPDMGPLPRPGTRGTGR